MKQIILLVSLLTLASVFIYAQVTEEWVKRYNNPPIKRDEAKFVKLDSVGNIYVSGESYTSTDTIIVIIKYNSSGVVKWIQTYSGSIELSAMAVDAPGNVYITVFERGISSNFDYVTIKYNTSGIQQWIARYNGPVNGIDLAAGVVVDALGNVYVTGRSEGGGEFSGATVKYNSSGVQQWVQRKESYAGTGLYIAIDGAGNVYTAGQYSVIYSPRPDFYVVKYNSAGVLQWERTLNVAGGVYCVPRGIVVSNTGNIVVGGSVFLPFLKEDYYTFKYNTAGVLQWEADYDGGGQSDRVHSIGADALGNIYITGFSQPSASLPSDCVTIKYNSAGLQQWIRRYDGTAGGADAGNSLSLDAGGNIYVSGYTNAGGQISGIDYLTIKYSPSGVQRWIQTYNGPGNFTDIAASNAVDASGNVYVTGSSLGFGTNNDFATIKYSQESGFILLVIERLDHLSNKIDTLIINQVLPANYGAMLKNNLQAAGNQLNQGHPNIAILRMQLFKFEVNLFIQLQILPQQLGQPLITGANEIISLIQQGGNGNGTSIQPPPEEKRSFSLEQNYPNPFNPVTNIRYEIPFNSHVSLKVYDAIGREAASLVETDLNAGIYEAQWNASNYSSGVYFYKLIAEIDGQKFEKTMKMIVVK